MVEITETTYSVIRPADRKDAASAAPEVKDRHREIWEIVERRARGIDELEAGYAIRFPLEDTLFLNLAELITYERLCCPFLQFDLELKSGAEEVSLRFTGGDGVKEYLITELAPLMKRMSA